MKTIFILISFLLYGLTYEKENNNLTKNTNASYGYDVMSGGDFQFISAYLGDRDFIQKRSLKRSF